MRDVTLDQPNILIKTALALSRRMQRNWNNRVEAAVAQSRIIQGGDKPAPDQMTKMNMLAVFKIENDVARDAAAAIGRDRCIKVDDTMRTVRAGKCGRDRAVERFRAFCTKRWHGS